MAQGKGTCHGSLKSRLPFWNPHEGRRESPAQRCPLTFIHIRHTKAHDNDNDIKENS